MHGQAINPHMTKHMAPSHVPVQSPLKPLPHMPMIVAFAAPSNMQLSPSHVMSHWAVPEQSNVQPPPGQLNVHAPLVQAITQPLPSQVRVQMPPTPLLQPHDPSLLPEQVPVAIPLPLEP